MVSKTCFWLRPDVPSFPKEAGTRERREEKERGESAVSFLREHVQRLLKIWKIL